MGHRKNKGKSKKGKSKKNIEKNNRDNIYQKEQENSKKMSDAVYEQTVIPNNKVDVSDIPIDTDTSKIGSETVTINTSSSDDAGTTNNTDNTEKAATDTTSNTDSDADASNNAEDMDDYCEEVKERQEQLFNKLKNLSETLVALTLIRDNINTLKVDTITELYFVRQVRPLLDALNIISFASTNMSTAATSIQTNAFGETKEIKQALKLTYRMNDEVGDIIDTLDRRLTIFLKQINYIDRNCPPFNSGKDS